MKVRRLSELQEQIRRVVVTKVRTTGRPPTLSEVSETLGESPASIRGSLASMRAREAHPRLWLEQDVVMATGLDLFEDGKGETAQLTARDEAEACAKDLAVRFGLGRFERTALARLLRRRHAEAAFWLGRAASQKT